MTSTRLALLVGAWTALLAGCAEVPAERYGISRLALEGVEEMDPRALRACLATAQRERFDLNFGRTTEPTCNQPPFESTTRLRIPLWKWPWTDWPLYDRNVFERDLARVERWYRARGYYDARVTASTAIPSDAALQDRVTEDSDCERLDDDEGCEVELGIRVEEGTPVIVDAIEMDGVDRVSELDAEETADLQESLRDTWQLEVGERFDETFYEQSKERMLRQLHESGRGCARVTGDVALDPQAHSANVRFTVEPGPSTHIGYVSLVGNEDLRASTILAVANIEHGDLYKDTLLESARHAIYALGAFSSVEVVGYPRRDDEGTCTLDEAGHGVVDVQIRVTPGRLLRYGVGVGVQAGILGTGAQSQPVPQWDVHLLGFIEHRNFLGGLRRARLEVRPKVIFSDQFPDLGDGARPGLETRLELRQPAFIEPRTTLVFTSRYDLGPDPFLYFFRHDLDAAIGVRRNFFDGRLSVAIGVHANMYRVAEDFPNEPPYPPSDYNLLFLEQLIQLDLRDDTRNPTKGVYFSVEAHESGLLTFDYLRFVPDARAYVPLGPLVLAGRFRLGWMKIYREDPGLDPISAQLGPQRYRLRAGGATSHRGFPPGFLGDGGGERVLIERDVDGDGVPDRLRYEFLANSGGLRRWEASLELRIPVNEDFGLVTFADMGDVNRAEAFRFDYIRLALGFGLRYQTIVGPVRLDFGFLVPGAQVIGQDAPDTTTEVRIGRLRWNGAVHLTIGEAF
ncbi:MAG: BamA/TamA family outer membrane protein [Deltaproteobacteria bacterium]|nr:BamA/TamA family outer membrane protein [Deltaproteobacteria bacterium]